MEKFIPAVCVYLFSTAAFGQVTGSTTNSLGEKVEWQLDQKVPARSIHQEQAEQYSKYKFTTEQEWDNLRAEQNGRSPLVTFPSNSAVCTLQKRVFGWHPYWNGTTYNNYQWNLLTDLSFFSYEVDATTGNAVTTHGWSTANVVTVAQANGVKVNLCATLFSNHATFLTSSTAKQTFISNIISLVQQRNANGCNIDFEGVPSAQSANFTSFMISLCNQMHNAIPNSEVSIALPAVDWSAVYDVTSMAPYVDLFIIMGYDYYWSGSTTAGPTDPLYNFLTGYNYTLTKSITYYLNKSVPNAKLLLGLPYYGREWPTSSAAIGSSTTGSGVSRIYNYVRNNTSGYYSNQLWDANSFTPYYAFNNGSWNQCFCNSAYSMQKRYDVVNQRGIGGIGIWALGYDDGYTELWDAIKNKFSDCAIVACTDTIYDMGGPNRNYYDNEDYTFTIAPQGASTVTLNFSSFNTEVNFDFLYLYDGPNTNSPLIGTYSGTSSPGTVTSTGSSITVRYKSDGATVAPGYTAVWNCNTAVPANLSVTSSTCPVIGVTLNWTNSGNGWYADVSDDPNFSYFWNKSVSNVTSTVCPGTFCLYPNCSSYLKFKPNTTYYWRIWNGSTETYGTPFTTPNCTSTLTSCSGNFYDSGGPSNPYSGNEYQTTVIAPTNAQNVTISFSSFNTENGFDSLYVYDGNSINAPLIGGYTGTAGPGTITSSGNALTFVFISDPFVNNAGWAASWTCSPTGIGATEMQTIAVFPNPSNGQFTVYGLPAGQAGLLFPVEFKIYNSLGELVYNRKPETGDRKLIDISDQPAGIYLLRFNDRGDEKSIKLIRE